MSDDVLLAISTFPDSETAARIAAQLVQERLAACANIMTAPVRSIYHWQGRVEQGEETLVFFKSSVARFDDFQRRLKVLHPYEVPEIVALPVKDGLPAYLAWVHESTRSWSNDS